MEKESKNENKDILHNKFGLQVNTQFEDPG